MATIVDQLFEIILKDWDIVEEDRRPICQFCRHRQASPTQEWHYRHCPRLLWAEQNGDSPKARAERIAGREYPNWPSPALVPVSFYRGPYLYDDGHKILALLAEHDPDHYMQHWVEHSRDDATYKQERALEKTR